MSLFKKTAVFLILGLFIAGIPLVEAVDLNGSYPCPNGGEVVFTGSYEPTSRSDNLNLATTIDGCGLNGITVTGLGTTTGTVGALPVNTPSVDLTTVHDLTMSKSDGSQVVVTITQTIDGTYDPATNQVTGDIERTVNGTGTWDVTLLELLGLDIQQIVNIFILP